MSISHLVRGAGHLKIVTTFQYILHAVQGGFPEIVVLIQDADQAIVVRRATVRLCIRCVLHAELQVDLGASPGVGLAEGHIIGFEDEGVLVGLASAPAAGRYRLAPDGDRQTDLHHSSSVVSRAQPLQPFEACLTRNGLSRRLRPTRR
jgi:hypothetical protein